MRGRDYFLLFSAIMFVGKAILSILPRFLVYTLLAISRHIPTKIGLGLRYMLVSRLAKSCGKCVAIYEGVYLRNLENVELGDHISIHPMCYFDGIGGLTIGNNVSIAHATSILTFNHTWAEHKYIRNSPIEHSAVNIGNDVWIGCGVRVMPGASIADRVVIGAGAVVTKPIMSNSLALGIPARSVPLHKTERKAA